MSLEQQVKVPLSTVIRIRRKRTAPPSTEWVVASKKIRGDDAEEDNPSAVFKLTATADKPSISAISQVIQPSKVAVVEYDLVNGVLNKPKVVDKDQEQIDEAAELVEKMDFTENSAKNAAPLASNESLDDEQYVYDFYAPSQQTFLNFEDDMIIRHITDEERQLMFVDDGDDDSSINADDDQDSNDENNYANEYPDEDEFDEEHDTTDGSGDDFDHYGDDSEDYSAYLDDD